MVIPIQVLVSFYTKEFRNQDPFNRNVIDGNAWFLLYVRSSVCLEPAMKRNSVHNQIIIKPLINIVDVTTSVVNACIIGVHSRLRVTQTIAWANRLCMEHTTQMFYPTLLFIQNISPILIG